MSRSRVVIAGLGDTGLLTAIGLSRHVDVVGISTKPGLVSGLTGVDLIARTVTVKRADGTKVVEAYDVLVISTGVTNGFWRQPDLRSTAEVDADLRATHERLAVARSVTVVGGGAAAVSAAANLAARWPEKQVDRTGSPTSRSRGAPDSRRRTRTP